MLSHSVSERRWGAVVGGEEGRFSGAVAGEPGPAKVGDPMAVRPAEQRLLLWAERRSVEQARRTVMLPELADDDRSGLGKRCHDPIPAGLEVARRPFRAGRGVVV